MGTSQSIIYEILDDSVEDLAAQLSIADANLHEMLASWEMFANQRYSSSVDAGSRNFEKPTRRKISNLLQILALAFYKK